MNVGDLVPTFNALRAAGFTREILERIKKDKHFTSLLGEVVADSGIRELPEKELALANYLGEETEYWGTRAWSEAFWIFLTENQLNNFPAFPWPMELLEEPCPLMAYMGKCRGENRGKYIPIRESHIIYLGLDKVGSKVLSPTLMQRLANDHSRGYHTAGEQMGRTDFFKTEHAKFRWYMMFQEPVHDSWNKPSYQDQLALLPPGYENPSAIEVVQCHYLCRNDRCNSQPFSCITGAQYLWTSTTATFPDRDNEQRICLGKAEGNWFGFFRTDANSESLSRIGIAASRIPGQ
jgi:hypothetical protein